MKTTLEESLLEAASDDWVSFAELLYLVREEAPEISETVAREEAVLVAEDLAKRGLWQAGDITTSGFSAWKLSLEDVSPRIRQALQTLSGRVGVGDICWFAITEHGVAAYAKIDPRANKALEPTPTSVTDRATHAPRQP